MMTNTPDQRYVPLEVWMAEENVSAADLLLAERHSAHLPLWVPDRGRVLVDTHRLYEWRQLVRIMDKIFEPDFLREQRPGGAA